VATDHPYSSNQDAIEAVLSYVCRQQRLSPDAADEFSQWTRLKLIEDDCAILRAFKGLSSFKTFMHQVISRKYRDWLDVERGKFRVTQEAKRLGPIATELERLVLRDKTPYDEAAQLLVSKGVAQSIKQCDEIWGRLKRAVRRHFVSDDELELRYPGPSIDPLEEAERRRLVEKVQDALHASLAALPAGDNLLFRWRFWDKFTVAQIAKRQGIEQKPLYRRYEQIYKQLERDLIARGITKAELGDLFGSDGIDFDSPDDEDGK
jgi:RNA polymerase sigma factor (sigma-70 family)